MKKELNNKTSGLYIHIPFCKSKCPYCDFYSVTLLSLIPDYLEGIKKEILFYYKEWPFFFDSLYFGGGTPTVISEPDLANLMEYFFKHFSFSPQSEITIEANPDDITSQKLKLFKNLGINRISLGVQSFDDQDLQYLQRRHSTSQNKKALEIIKTEEFPVCGIDLIYGLEIQTEKTWLKTLKQALGYHPEHISCYELTLKNSVKIRPADEQKVQNLFILTSLFLEDNGYIHYEVSNYARKESYICQHNWKYWHHIPYLGIGPSAHSFFFNQRWWNINSVKKYCQLLKQNSLPTAGKEELDKEQLRLESIYLGLRTKSGINIQLVGKEAKKKLSDLAEDNLIKIEGDKIIPTTYGYLFSDTISLLLFD
ncbi:MAG: radical SAM family heme chaperone HemW [Desulfobacterota bacterium]|nr:radical SAM family heme chaperone HemW [Thermodesulfobacteriota bacterium]